MALPLLMMKFKLKTFKKMKKLLRKRRAGRKSGCRLRSGRETNSNKRGKMRLLQKRKALLS
jgi:hypothetical protein